MGTKLLHVGEVATREMAEHGEVRDPVFDRAAAEAARSAGLSQADIADMFGTLSLRNLLKDRDSVLLEMLGVRVRCSLITEPIRTSWGEEVDFVAQVDEPGERPCLVYVGLQTSTKEDMLNRMLSYYAAILLWTGERPEYADVHIRPIILYVGSPRRKPKTVIQDFNLRFSPQYVDAHSLDPAPLLESENLGDVAFSVLGRDGKRPSVVRRALARIADAPQDEGSAAMACFSTLCELRGIDVSRFESEIARRNKDHAASRDPLSAPT